MTAPRWLDLNADETPDDVVLPIATRVKQGFGRLDEKYGPEWVFRINVDTLRLESSCLCVLGQLCGDFATGVLGMFDADWFTAITDFGFHAADDEEYEWDALTTEWRSQILARRLELAS